MTKRRIALEKRQYWTEAETARLVAAWADVRQGTRTARQVLTEFPGRTLQSIRVQVTTYLSCAGPSSPEAIASQIGLPVDQVIKILDDNPRRFDVDGKLYRLKGRH